MTPPGTTVTIAGRAVDLVCHRALLSGRYHDNTRAAIAECFEAGAGRIEVDVHSLAGDDYIVYHERKLEAETDVAGSVGRATPDIVRGCRFKHDPDDRPLLLSELVELAKGCDTELQLDLKDWRPLPDERIRPLLRAIAPVQERVIISCGQDWNLRRIHRADPTLAYGFDPGHYLDAPLEETPFFLPRTMGAYGYRDDSPLAVGRTEATADYLRERFDGLLAQVPGAREFFLSYRLILQMLDDGFDAAGWLHERGIAVTAWTLDRLGPASLAAAERLAAAGVDRITTNTPLAWRETFARTASRA